MNLESSIIFLTTVFTSVLSHYCYVRQAEKIYLLGGGTQNQTSMWLNTVDVYSPTTHSCQPATSLPKECAYGSAVAIGNMLFYVGGGNGIDWFSSMLRLPLGDAQGDWEQVRLRSVFNCMQLSKLFMWWCTVMC